MVFFYNNMFAEFPDWCFSCKLSLGKPKKESRPSCQRVTFLRLAAFCPQPATYEKWQQHILHCAFLLPLTKPSSGTCISSTLSHIHPDPWEQKPGEQEGVSNCHHCLAKPPDTGNLTLNKKESLARIFQQLLQGKRQCSVQIHQLKSWLFSPRPHSKASQLLESKMARTMTQVCPQMTTSEFEAFVCEDASSCAREMFAVVIHFRPNFPASSQLSDKGYITCGKPQQLSPAPFKGKAQKLKLSINVKFCC